MESYGSFIERLNQDNKICLTGKYWDEAFKIIWGNIRHDNSILPVPLILSAWNMSDDFQKAERFRRHLDYAFDKGKWANLMAYIDKLPDEAWHKIS